MNSGTLQQLDRTARAVTPVVLCFFLVMFSALPLRIPAFGPVAPNIAVMAVFYWAVYRPDHFPVVAAFGIGLWQDILVGVPLGVNALVLLLAHWVLDHQRRFFVQKSFFVVWWAFGLVAFGAQILVWLLVMIMYAALINPLPGVFQLMLTVAVYPFVTWLFARTHHAVLREA